MKIKTNLHLHTNDDLMDPVDYSIYDAVLHAKKDGFQALALTCHQKYAWRKEYADYARSQGILLLPGIEINVDESRGTWGKHVLIVNAHPEAEEVCTFDELSRYRDNHPESLIIAPHPYFYGNFSLHHFLEKYISLFDGIEHSWFYSSLCNRNKKAERFAKRYDMPFIVTSDTHYLNFMNENYALIDAEVLTADAIVSAIREKKFENVTSPRKFFQEMVIPQGKFFVKMFLARHHFKTNRKLLARRKPARFS